MHAAQHAIVWNNVSDRLKRTAEAAGIEATPSTETLLLILAVFAGTVAVAYKDTAITILKDSPMSDAWHREGVPQDGDSRKLVTIEQRGGMIYVGIRAWSESRHCWLNNGVLEQDKILAWQDLPAPPYSDGLMNPMEAPTLSDHWST